MKNNAHNFSNICVLNFGQLGDVLLSFPALHALRDRFPHAKITVVGGKTPANLIHDIQLADDVVAVDRHRLLNGPKVKSIFELLELVREIRRRKFDLVIDLHSLYETNTLGWLSGCRTRLFASRGNRSLDFLGNFKPRPPKYDPARHLADIYLDVLRPLGLIGADRHVHIEPPQLLADQFRTDHNPTIGSEIVAIGIAIGAGNASRRWELSRFVELARRLLEYGKHHIFVFLGPEEKKEEAIIRSRFDGLATVVPDLSLIELAAAFSTLDLVIGNDTGTTHLAALVASRVVMICDERAPVTYAPLGAATEVVKTATVAETTVDDVWQAVMRSSKNRADQKEQPKEDEPDQRKEH